MVSNDGAVNARCIWTMSKHYVDVWGLQALQTALEPFYDVLPGQASGIWLLATSAEKDLPTSVKYQNRGISINHLCTQNVFVARPPELLQCLSHLNLRLTVGVDLRCVEEVDAIVPSCLKTVLDDGT
jgi:hypothetical protein